MNQPLIPLVTPTERFRGLLFGTAVGDALGLPREGLEPARARKLFPEPFRHRMFWGYGVTSDDTDHTLMVARALLKHPRDPAAFARSLAWYLRLWILSLPPGIGFATLRSIIKLWCGFGPTTSGVYSAGNGPAMRVAPIGAFFAQQPELREAYVRACTQITHTDPRALIAAQAVAEMAAWIMDKAVPHDLYPGTLIWKLDGVCDIKGIDPQSEAVIEWKHLVTEVGRALEKNLTVTAFAQALDLGHGISGYAYHTVIMAIYAWFHHRNDFHGTIESIIACGGDTDTTAAIAGALAGCTTGTSGIPNPWKMYLIDWPRSIAFYWELGAAMAEAYAGQHSRVPWYFTPGLLAKNLATLPIIFLHVVRRMLPPY